MRLGTELLACVSSITYDNQCFIFSLMLCGLKQWPLTFETGAKEAFNWSSDDTTGLIFFGKQGIGGPLINLSAMITTYIRGESIFFCPVLQRGPGGALHAPTSLDMLTGKQLIRCQKFISPLFNIAYLSLACHFKTRGIA